MVRVNLNYFLIDDVSVTLLDPSLPPTLANVTIPQTNFCIDENVTVDGSFSENETSYLW